MVKGAEDQPLIARCMGQGCKCPREMVNINYVKTKKGTWMAKGKCVKCGTSMCKFVPKDKCE